MCARVKQDLGTKIFSVGIIPSTYLISTAHKRSQSDEYVKPGQKKQKLEDGKYAGIYRQQQKLITSFQLCIGYQIGYNPVITFSCFGG